MYARRCEGRIFRNSAGSCLMEGGTGVDGDKDGFLNNGFEVEVLGPKIEDWSNNIGELSL